MNVIGLISGTSVDGIDAALVSLAGSTTDLTVDLIAANTYPYPEELRSQILAVCGGAALSMEAFAALDDAIAYHFAQAALTLQAKHSPVDLIGSHGQTVYHRPSPSCADTTCPVSSPSLGYSLQLGRGCLIAHLTGIPTISNFRAADIAAGGQGAPLVSPIDVCLLSHPTYHRCIQNIGGIGNVTYLPPTSRSVQTRHVASLPIPSSSVQTQHVASLPAPRLPIVGWDTGPGNALLDLAVYRLSNGEQTFDQDGSWATQGKPCMELVRQWLQQDFFQQPPPKSTGRELFGEDYLDRCLQDAAPYSLSSADLLATLTELTAASIAHSYRSFLPHMPDQVLLCGGGSRNPYLRQRIQANLAPAAVHTTDEMGLSADFKEAISFAVLAYWRYCNIPGNLPEVTGAKRSVLLGEIHLVA